MDYPRDFGTYIGFKVVLHADHFEATRGETVFSEPWKPKEKLMPALERLMEQVYRLGRVS